MTTTPSTAEPADPIFAPVVTGDAIADEAGRFMQALASLSPQEIAMRLGWTLAIVAGAIALLWLLRFALRFTARLLSPKQEKEGQHGKEARRNVGAWTMVAARFIITLIVIGWILYIWGFDVRGGALGRVLGMIWRIGFIVIIATGISEVVAFAISRVLQSGARRSNDLRRAAQMRTLAPVLAGVMHSIIGVIALMMALSEIGLDVGPLIAGAGVVGIAIGFGAQSIVKDFLTGVFFIVEDIVSVGDVVRIGDSGGVVEAMTLRTIRLRDFDGTLHIFPYGEAQVVHNMTKTFSFYAFNLSISYSADVNTALQLMREIGDQMQHEPPFQDAILEPIEVVGVDALADNGVRVKARIKTKPGQQWGVGREYLKRIKLAFDANGVQMQTANLRLIPPDQRLPPPADHSHAAE
ncbi:MAG TPA: mechanosensitive ion channel family protein [Vitreimonas sp.]|nr:mechanosensitive ion channel family protein [Vitreimonas sp.]